MTRTQVTLGILAALHGGGVARAASPGWEGLTAPSLTYPEQELGQAIAEISGTDAPDYHSTAFWYGGHLGIVYAKGMLEGGLSLFDVSDPYQPTLVGQNGHIAQREGHTAGFIGSPIGWLLVSPASNGLNLWDLSDPTRPKVYKNITLKGILPSDYDFGTWWTAVQYPYVYVAGAYNGIYVLDLSNLSRPQVVNHLKMTDGFRCGAMFAVGTWLIQHSSEGTRVRVYDVSDPALPQLRKEFELLRTAYASNVNGGYFFGATEAGGVEIVDIDDPLDPQTLSYLHTSGGGAYITVQMPYVHLGNSDAWYKIDVEDPYNPVAVLSAGIESDREVDVDFPSHVGNLVVLSDDHNLTAANIGSRIVVHDTRPDTLPPEVNWVIPRDGAADVLPLARVGLTFTDSVLVESIDSTSVIVREQGGTSVLGAFSVQQNTVTFAPAQPLKEHTTYEIVVPAGAVADWVGNTNELAFVSEFTTGLLPLDPPIADGGPDLTAWRGEVITLDASATQGGYGEVQYSWDPGDGSPPSAWSTNPRLSHTYGDLAHVSAVVTARDTRGQISTDVVRVTVAERPIDPAPTHSSTLAEDLDNGLIWVVNPDADTVAAVDPAALRLEAEILVGDHPRTLALTPDGRLFVTLEDEGAVAVVDPLLQAATQHIALPLGSRPFGVAADPSEPLVYVSLSGTGELVAISTDTLDVVWSADVGPNPRGVAVSGEALFVSRFISPASHGEVVQLDRVSGALSAVWELAEDPGPDNDIGGRGVPNYLSQVVPAPDGHRVFVPGMKQNTSRGLTRDGQPLTFESTNRALVITLDTRDGEEDLSRRVDLDNRDFASALALSPLGDYAFITLQGSQDVVVVDTFNGQEVGAIEYVGMAPQGALVTQDGLLFVQNFMGRDVTVYDVSNFADPETLGRLASVRTVRTEPLSNTVLLGKRIFYNSADTRISRDSYISCAGCHLDGGTDERVWDFTDRGEGLRRTVGLNGHGGMLHGPVHWSANFDEIQDFENDIRNAFGGSGFLSDADWQATSATLGTPKAGRSPELDALAAYVGSLLTAETSPWRVAGGQLSPAAERGRALFNSAAVGCATCHSGAAFTDSALTGGGGARLHDVGTLTAASGKRMGQPLTGLDTPSLKAVWKRPSLLHDGSAASVREVLTTRNSQDLHGSTSQLTPSQLADLEQYVLSIDGHSGAPVVGGMSPEVGARQRSVAQVSVMFTSILDPATAAAGLRLTRGGSVVAGDWSAEGNVALFVPAATLPVGAYTVEVSAGLRSVDGDAALAWSGAFDVADAALVADLKVWSGNAAAYSLQSGLRRGVKVYGDDDDRLLTVPQSLVGLSYLRVGHNDGSSSKPGLIQFTLSTANEVYVAFDRKQKVLPSWAADFTDTGLTLATTDIEDSPRKIYRAVFPPGRVTLGGSRQDGGGGNRLPYLVIVGDGQER